jgi:hypothetical protein
MFKEYMVALVSIYIYIHTHTLSITLYKHKCTDSKINSDNKVVLIPLITIAGKFIIYFS